MNSPKTLHITHPQLQQAIGQYQAGKLPQALNSFKTLLTAYPDDPGLLNTLGTINLRLGDAAESVRYNSRSVEINPQQAATWFYLGIGLKQLQRFAPALEAFDKAIHLQADFAEAYCNRGNLLQDLHRYSEALSSFERAIALRPDYALAFLNRGITLKQLNRLAEAVSSYDRAIALQAEFAEAWCYRGNALLDMGQLDAAMHSYSKALAVNPKLTEAWYHQGLAQYKMQHYRAALDSLQQAQRLKPDYDFLAGQLLFTQAQLCDWQHFDSALAKLKADIGHGQRSCFPFASHAFFDDPALQRQAAEIWTQAKCPANPQLPLIPAHSSHDKIRIGYFSADFRQHPVAFLSAELFELHDRQRFEIIAVSYAPSANKDPMRLQLETVFDRFIDIRQLADAEAWQLLRELEIDIAVDLGGHTSNNRLQLFAMRVAPLQISYLGFSGTLGTEYMDYLLADQILIPETSLPFYAEKIAYLPNSFMVNDSRRPIATAVPSRAACGLPTEGFVFCCFNNTWKFNPTTFSSWMRILEHVPGSVLWLSVTDPLIMDNLRQTAQQQGIAPQRLVFADRVPEMADHLARLALADLFLDTLPYNAHASSGDALWAGLPVLTCLGASFAGRVAASLLSAVGLPELITHSAAEYQALAVALGNDRPRIASLKQKLLQNRHTEPLFNTALFTQQLENLYGRIWQRYQAGLPAEHLLP